MTQKKIAELSSKIHLNPQGRDNGFTKPFLKELEKVDYKSFVLFNYENYSNVYVKELMVECRIFLEKISLEEWAFIVEELRLKKYSLVNLISFVCTFIRIDFLHFIEDEKILDGQFLLWLNDYIQKRPGYLSVGKIDCLILEKRGLSFKDFLPIRERLKSEGCREYTPKITTLIPFRQFTYNKETKNYDKGEAES